MDEQALIQDAIQGDLDAFNRLVLEYQKLAFNVAFRLLADDASGRSPFEVSSTQLEGQVACGTARLPESAA